MSDQKPFRVIMWCVPRSISTAITKCFSFIENTEIWFEPFCSIYMLGTMVQPMGLQLPQNEDEVDAFATKLTAMMKGTAMEKIIGGPRFNTKLILRRHIQQELNSPPSDKNVFMKEMTFGITNHFSCLPSKESGFRHTFLIRNPERMFPSWRNLMMKSTELMPMPGQPPVQKDTFDLTKDVPYVMPGLSYKCQYDFWKYVKENCDPNPVVIDVDELISNPAAMLPKYFAASGMPWDDKLLQWDASPDIARQWRGSMSLDTHTGDGHLVMSVHGNALTSSEFAPSKPKIARSKMTPDVVKAIDETMGYYEEMAASRITL